jgi:TonB-dependent SusC/RagA subfamily outer membrane receptor
MSIRSTHLLHLGAVAAILSACSGNKAETAPSPTRPAASTDASTVTRDEVERTPRESVEKYLEGRVAGVVVGQAPGGGLAVRIRGASSFQTSEGPLYILDGLPIQTGPNGTLVGVNPYDIESIKVLKDPADTAMYGVRGANGVIIIKTKRSGAARPRQ